MSDLKMERLDDFRWIIPKQGNMRVPGIIYSSGRLMDSMGTDESPRQVANVANLPGIVKYSLAMPDAHWGYGFPIGGVAATDPDPGGVISPDDFDRVLVTDSVDAAVNEITGFYRNYDSLRWVGKRLVVRLHAAPSPEEIDDLNERFGDLLAEGRIEATAPLKAEVKDGDRLDLPRIVLTLNQFNVGSLHRLIRALNDLPSQAPGQSRA